MWQFSKQCEEFPFLVKQCSGETVLLVNSKNGFRRCALKLLCYQMTLKSTITKRKSEQQVEYKMKNHVSPQSHTSHSADDAKAKHVSQVQED